MVEQRSGTQLKLLVESARNAMAEQAARNSFEPPYRLPDRRPNPAAETLDWVRCVLLAVVGLLLLVTSIVCGSGLGARSETNLLDTVLVHSIFWPVIGIALILCAGFGILPHQLASRRQRAVMLYPIIAGSLMSCALCLAAGFLALPAAIVATLATLAGLFAVSTLNRHTARNQLERMATDVPISFFTGFSLLYTTDLWFAALGWVSLEHAVAITVVTVIVAIVAAVYAHSERGRHAFASGFSLALIAAAIHGYLEAANTLWVCALWVFLAIVVVICAENRRVQITHAEHRVRAGKQLDF